MEHSIRLQDRCRGQGLCVHEGGLGQWPWPGHGRGQGSVSGAIATANAKSASGPQLGPGHGRGKAHSARWWLRPTVGVQLREERARLESMLAAAGSYEWMVVEECPSVHAGALAARPRVWYVGYERGVGE